MRRRAIGVLSACSFILASVGPVMAQAEPSDEPPTRTVEIPGAGAVVTIPRTWRTWLPEGYLFSQVRTTDPDSGWTCALWSDGDLVSAESAADALVEAPEAGDIGISRSEPFEVPAGSAVIVTFGSPEGRQPPAHIQREAHVDAPQGVVQVWCGPAPADHVRDVAMAIAPLGPDYTPEPFDRRVELADHGFSVDFGPEWSVGFDSPGSLTGGPTVLTAQLVIHDEGRAPLSTCRIEDASDVPQFHARTTPKHWKKAFIEVAEGRRGRELTTTAVQLVSGPAIRADWPKLFGMPTTAWVVSDDDHVIVLWCQSKRPPGDGWRYIADSIEFLAAEE